MINKMPLKIFVKKILNRKGSTGLIGSMRRTHIRAPFVFGVIILILLLFKLSGVSLLFASVDCTLCTIGAPQITWFGAGYFAGLLTLIYLEPRLFSRCIASFGILFAIAMGTVLLWLSPTFCYICFVSHLLHVAIWGYFLIYPQSGLLWSLPFKIHLIHAVRMGLLLTIAYSLIDKSLLTLSEKHLTQIPHFSFTTLQNETIDSQNLQPYKYIIMQFTLPQCTYCKEQLPRLNALAQIYRSDDIGFFNIVVNQKKTGVEELEAHVSPLAPLIPIAIDEQGRLARLLHVRAYPTLIVLNDQGDVVQTIIGSSAHLEQKINILRQPLRQ